jgi:hypothetical protein
MINYNNILQRYAPHIQIEQGDCSFKPVELSVSGPRGVSGFTYEAEKFQMSLTFNSVENYNQLMKDLSLLEKVKQEENMRSNNPVVQRAYEEYQILLKLTNNA